MTPVNQHELPSDSKTKHSILWLYRAHEYLITWGVHSSSLWLVVILALHHFTLFNFNNSDFFKIFLPQYIVYLLWCGVMQWVSTYLFSGNDQRVVHVTWQMRAFSFNVCCSGIEGALRNATVPRWGHFSLMPRRDFVEKPLKPVSLFLYKNIHFTHPEGKQRIIYRFYSAKP